MTRIPSITLAIICWIAGLLCGACDSGKPTRKVEPGPSPGDADSGVVGGSDAGADDGADDAAVPVRCLPGTCGDDKVCDTKRGTCRPPLRCEDLSCSLHQLCKKGDEPDAVCEGCEAGYRWQARDRLCEAVRSCDGQAPGSILQSCAAENRLCVDSEEGASCGDCVQGAEMHLGKCVVATCEKLEVPCVSPQVCTEGPTGASCGACEVNYRWDEAAARCLPTCSSLVCPSDEWCVEGEGSTPAVCRSRVACGEGQVASSEGVCVPCGHCYDSTATGPVPKAGVKGLGNEGRTEGNICVCDLKDNYFQALTAEVLPCDADSDGWLNRRATILSGTAMGRHSRCTVPRVDRFLLQSDDLPDVLRPGVTRTLTLSVADLLKLYPDIPSDAWELVNGVKMLRLVEEEALDEADKFIGRYEDAADEFSLHEYGDGKPRLVPAQANPLTKLCNHPNDDFNMDRVADVSQSQLGGAVGDGAFFHLAYFAELADGRFVDEDGDGVGAYLIAERARRGDGAQALPFLLGLQSDKGTPYAASCMRSRDVSYPGHPKANEPPAVGCDFAQFQCATERGGCQVGEGSGAHVAYDGRVPRYIAALERLAATQAGGVPRPWDSPPDGGYQTGQPLWPGMNHHSQFKCIAAGQALPPSAADQRWTWHGCGLTKEEGDKVPRFDCDALRSAPKPSDQRTHWAVAEYRSYATPQQYTRGCIDEDAEWNFACGAWSGRHGTNQPFSTEAVFTGEFTCESGCSRGGTFVIVEQGGLCCYGDPRTTCEGSAFEPSTEPELLCALEASSVDLVAHVDLTCAAALGAFRWGDQSTSVYDPNSLQWTAEGPANNESVWQ